MRYLKPLYVQVLLAIGLGILVGWLDPQLGEKLRPLGDGFIKLVKMLIAPIIFCTIVSGIAGMGDLKKIGRLGGKALLYFEIVTTFALAIGLVVANLAKPGAGINADLAALDAGAVAGYTKAAAALSTAEFLLHIIPETFVGAFAHGEILQVLFISLLFGFGLARLGPAGGQVITLIHHVSHAFFAMVGIVTKLAPIGAFGAMGFTIGKYGIGTLFSLGKLLACVYLTSALFVFIVLGTIAHLRGFSLWRILVYIREEILIVLGTSSSESALPGLMTKLEQAGCSRSAVGIVVPAGYSFNLDGTSIYLTMAAIFIAQATNVSLTLGQELGLLAILLLTSKGAAGVTGSGFVTLAATLAATHSIPVEGMALILGVDRFMSECRAITNLIGNAVGMFVVAEWEQDIDLEKAAPLLTRSRRRRLERSGSNPAQPGTL